jgi:hypothetical protein
MKNELVGKIMEIFMVPIAAVTLITAGLVNPPEAEAERGLYAGVQGDYAQFSDSHMDEVYGNMWGLGARVGYQTRRGLRAEAKLHTARAQGVDTIDDLGAVNFALTTRGLQLRLAKAFGWFDKLTPYIGIEGSRETLTQVLTCDRGTVFDDSFEALGGGVFGGGEVAFSNKQSGYIEVSRNTIPVGQSNLGGFTVSFGIKTRF